MVQFVDLVGEQAGDRGSEDAGEFRLEQMTEGILKVLRSLAS